MVVIAHGGVSQSAVVDSDYDANPQYAYGYDVHDSLTGDSKSQVESRSGDVVRGKINIQGGKFSNF